MKNSKSFEDYVKYNLTRKIDNASFIALQPNEQFLLFYSKLNEYFSNHYIMGLQVEMIEDGYFALYDRNDTFEKFVQSPSIKIFEKNLCDVSFLPIKDGIELSKLEVYTPEEGAAIILINLFTYLSKQSGIKIFVIPAKQGFYHRFGFKKINNSDYWCY